MSCPTYRQKSPPCNWEIKCIGQNVNIHLKLKPKIILLHETLWKQLSSWLLLIALFLLQIEWCFSKTRSVHFLAKLSYAHCTPKLTHPHTHIPKHTPSPTPTHTSPHLVTSIQTLLLPTDPPTHHHHHQLALTHTHKMATWPQIIQFHQ